MPDINFDCPFCKQNLDSPEDMTGLTIECPACGKAIRIPTPIYIHCPIKKSLGPQLAAGPKIFASKAGPPPGRVTGESPVTDEVKAKTEKIELPSEVTASTPIQSRFIMIKRTEK